MGGELAGRTEEASFKDTNHTSQTKSKTVEV